MLQYLLEFSLLDGEVFLQYLPSITAAAAICLANLMLGSTDPWVRLGRNYVGICRFLFILLCVD